MISVDEGVGNLFVLGVEVPEEGLLDNVGVLAPDDLDRPDAGRGTTRGWGLRFGAGRESDDISERRFV